jgi:hypothetical protein
MDKNVIQRTIAALSSYEVDNIETTTQIGEQRKDHNYGTDLQHLLRMRHRQRSISAICQGVDLLRYGFHLDHLQYWFVHV